MSPFFVLFFFNFIYFFANSSNVKTSSVRLNQRYFIWSSFSQTTTILPRPLQFHWQHLSFQFLQMWSLATMLVGCSVAWKEHDSLLFTVLVLSVWDRTQRQLRKRFVVAFAVVLFFCLFVCWGALRKRKQNMDLGKHTCFWFNCVPELLNSKNSYLHQRWFKGTGGWTIT